MHKHLLTLILVLIAVTSTQPAYAQDPTPATGPIYIVQTGDTLTTIAVRFNVPLKDLLAANNITDANALSIGQQLVIPGLQGINGILLTQVIPFGDSFNSVSRRNQISGELLKTLNHITSPAELYAGVSLVIVKDDDKKPLTRQVVLSQGETLLEAAVKQNADTWTLQHLNSIDNSWSTLPGDAIYTTGESSTSEQVNGLPAAFVSAQVNPLPLKQGGTAVIRITAAEGVTLGGALVDKPLHFFTNEDGEQIALQGIHALLEPGIYPLRLEATLPNGEKQSFEQMVVIQSGGYYSENLLVEPETIDPTVNENEFAQMIEVTSKTSLQKLWMGIFQSPAYFNDCATSRFGTRRTYFGRDTNQEYFSFHSGLDFCGGSGLPITASANGMVVFTGTLAVRGNATIIDHGWGIFTGYFHQSQINVNVGDTVIAGQVIGAVGATGRVTGAHLHWEIWVNGVQVNPVDWLDNIYP